MKTIKCRIPYRPRYPEVHRVLETHRFVVLVAHRRFGKTVLSINHLLKQALLCSKPRGIFAYVGPLRNQAKATAWNYLKHYSSPVPGRRVNEGELSIKLPNEATIRIFGADNPDALRGLYFDGVILDEVAQMKSEVWQEIIQPALADRQGWALFIGTPKGINLFSDLYYDALKRESKGDHNWTALSFPVSQTDALPQEEVARLKSELSDNAFRQEMLCDFAASSDNVLITIDEVNNAAKASVDLEAMMAWPIIVGVDVARFGDDSTVFFARRNLHAYPPVVLNHLSNMEVADRLMAYIAEVKPTYVCIDQGQGTGAPSSLFDPGKAIAMRSKLDQLKRQRVKQAGLTSENFANRIAYGLDTGDFSAAQNDVQTMRHLGLYEEAAKLDERLYIAQTAYTTLDAVRDLPLAKQAQEAEQRLQGLVTPENAKVAISMRDDVKRSIAQRMKSFVDDPAAYVSQMAAMQEPHLNEQDRIMHSLQLQQEIGQGVQFEPAILSKAQAKQFKQEYDNLQEPLQRAHWIRQIEKNYGDYTQQILREMKVPDTVNILRPVMNGLSDKTLGTFMHAIGTKPSDIAGDKDWRDAAKDVAGSSDMLKTAQDLARVFPGNPILRAQADKLQETYAKFVLLGGNPEELEGAFDAYGSSDEKCFFLLPRNSKISASSLASIANDKREEVRDQLLKEIPNPTSQQGRIAKSNIMATFDNGIFVTDESGRNVLLLDVQTGHPVSHNGQIISFSIEDLMQRPAPEPKIYFGE